MGLYYIDTTDAAWDCMIVPLLLYDYCCLGCMIYCYYDPTVAAWVAIYYISTVDADAWDYMIVLYDYYCIAPLLLHGIT